MTSNFLNLNFSTLYSSSLWRTDTILWVKLNKPRSLKYPPLTVLTPPPPPRLNVFERKKPPRGLIEDLQYVNIAKLVKTTGTLFHTLRQSFVIF